MYPLGLSGIELFRDFTRPVVLPGGCVAVRISRAVVWRCEGPYYERHSDRYVVHMD